MRPRVSLIVASHNYGRFVGEAIDSVLTQTFQAIELIVIDDCSTDDSREVLARYADEPRVRLVFHERNQGEISTYNEGLSLARGEFVGVLDSDDVCLRTDAVARQVAVFDANPNVGLVYAAHTYIDQHSRQFQVFQPWADDYVRDGHVEFADLAFRNYVHCAGTLVRQTCHDVLGNYDPDLPHAGDWDLWLRVATSYDVGYIAEPLYGYRFHGENMSVTRHSPGQANREILMAVNHGFDALPPHAPDSLRRQRASAIRHALLATSWGDRSMGRSRRSWAGLFDAARRAPSLLLTDMFYAAVVRNLLLTALGYKRYQRLTALRGAQPMGGTAALDLAPGGRPAARPEPKRQGSQVAPGSLNPSL